MHNWGLSSCFGSCEIANCFLNKKHKLLLVPECGILIELFSISFL